MGQLIEGAVVASTALDRHGEQLTRAELRQLFAQMPGDRLLNLNHDPRTPPVARAFNTRLDERPDGTLTIVSNVEVFDEERFAQVRGMSISYHRGSPDENAPSEAQRVVISFNPREIDREQLDAVLASAELPAGYIALSERSEKSFLGLALILVIVSHGFWEEAGADAWRLFKRLTKEAFGDDREAELAAISQQIGQRPQLVVCVPVGFDPDRIELIDENDLISQAQALAPGNELFKVVVLIDQSGKSRIDFAVDRSGTVIKPPQ